MLRMGKKKEGPGTHCLRMHASKSLGILRLRGMARTFSDRAVQMHVFEGILFHMMEANRNLLQQVYYRPHANSSEENNKIMNHVEWAGDMTGGILEGTSVNSPV